MLQQERKQPNIKPIDGENEIEERIIEVKRVSKKNKGGNRISFTVLMAVGDKKGRVGTALGKAPSVTAAIKKAITKARRDMVEVPIVEGGTIAHEMLSKFGASHIYIKPAPVGAGVIAGGSVRAILELAGITNVSAKILGTRSKSLNIHNMMSIFSKLNQSKKTKVKIK